MVGAHLTDDEDVSAGVVLCFTEVFIPTLRGRGRGTRLQLGTSTANYEVTTIYL